MYFDNCLLNYLKFIYLFILSLLFLSVHRIVYCSPCPSAEDNRYFHNTWYQPVTLFVTPSLLHEDNLTTFYPHLLFCWTWKSLSNFLCHSNLEKLWPRSFYILSVNLRSASRGDLIVPRFRLRRSGYRAFAVSGPHVWNSLPTEIRQSCNNLLQFKSKLNTFLFKQSWAFLWIHI